MQFSKITDKCILSKNFTEFYTKSNVINIKMFVFETSHSQVSYKLYVIIEPHIIFSRIAIALAITLK